MKILDRIPLWALAILALLMAIAPPGAQPHLVQKFMMLMEGTLVKPLDIFDLFWHGLFPLLFIAKLIRIWQLRSTEK